MEKLDADDPQLGVLMGQLKPAILEHIREEEGEAFPKLRQASTKDELDKLGTVVQGLKKIVPTHPHPKAPDHPPFNVLLGPGAALVDKVRDMLKR
jgi:hypothetical protein